MIFVQIAAYRDPELLPTIIDCIAKAKYPKNLNFGICWQTDSSDRSIEPLRLLENFRIDKVPWQKSEGLCWARARIQALYKGEDYTLQLDSHHRFAENWDDKLINACELTGSPKPIITTYAGIYDPATNEKRTDHPYKMVAERFTDSGTIIFRPHSIPGWQELKKPIPARFVSGHFYFTLGCHCHEYAYDPNLYFAGDEISLSIRSFTLGYDLFHPHRPVIWHEYTRQGRVKHWDDHTLTNKAVVAKAWHERDVISKRRLRKLLKEEDCDEDLTGYGLGNVRTHHDYELYAGIDFANRRLHPQTKLGIDPPCTYVEGESWNDCSVSERILTLKWNNDELEKCDDCQFVYFGVEDETGKVLYRHDAPPESAEAQHSINERAVQFSADSDPKKLVVWPYSHSRGWLKKSEFWI